MPLTITTWNIQNFQRSDVSFADKLNFLVGTLQALGSDVVALQEILDVEALNDLAQRLGFQAVAAAPDSRGNRVAFLVRNAPTQPEQQIDQWNIGAGIEVRGIDDNGAVTVLAQFPRPALQVTVTHNGREIDIITAHLKSKLLTFGDAFSTRDESLRVRTAYAALERRAAEAATLRQHVTALLAAGRDVVVLGDLNDGSEAATTQMMYGPPGSQPNGPKDAEHVSGAFQRDDGGDEQRLFNVTKLVDEQVRWTRRYNSQNELLDHILASAGLMPRVGGLRLVPTMSILNEDTPNLIGSHPTVGGTIPDHAPVTATFG